MLSSYLPCDLCQSSRPFTLKYKGQGLLATSNPIDLKQAYRSSSVDQVCEDIVECQNCGLIFLNPLPSEELVLKGYSQAVDHDYTSQAEPRIKSFEACIDDLERQMKSRNEAWPKGGQILDVGAAAGFFLKAAQEKGYQAWGIEPSKYLVNWSQTHLGVKNYSGTIFSLPAEIPQSMDVITLWDVLEHTESPQAQISRAAEILKKDGILVINYPDVGSIFEKIFKKRWWFYLSVHLFYFRPQTLRAYLQKNNFSVIYEKRHFQTLHLGYLIQRSRQYLGWYSDLFGKIVTKLGLDKIPIRYYASQKILVARKIS